MNPLSKDVMRALPQGNMTTQEYVGYLLQYLGKKKYLINYVDDYGLQYTIPVTVGEYIVGYGHTLDALMYIGGQGLVDKVGSMGWFLLLLLELMPLNFDINNVNIYQDIFNGEDFYVVFPNNMLDYILWKCYYVLSGADIELLKNGVYRLLVSQLENSPASVRIVMYSYLVRTFANMKIDFDSREFMNIFITTDYEEVKGNIVLFAADQTYGEMLFGELMKYNSIFVLFAEWYIQGYARVILGLPLNVNIRYNKQDLEKVTDVRLREYSGIQDHYLGREDFVNIIDQASLYMDGAIPTILNGKVVVTYRGAIHDIYKNIDEDDMATFTLDPHIPSVSTKMNSILKLIDYNNMYYTIYDRMRNADLYYKDRDVLVIHLAYMYILYMVQSGKYSGSYGTPQSRTDSYLYQLITADYLNYTVKSKYYKIPIGIIEYSILMQGYMTIDELVTFGDTITLENIFNTAILYNIPNEFVVTSAHKLWNEEYADGNGELGQVTKEYNYNAISYKQIPNYVEYVKRLSNYVYNYNEVKKTIPVIQLYIEEEDEYQEEE